MKKYVSILLAIVLCLSFSFSVVAKGENVYSYNGVDVIFEENSILSENMKLYVAEILVNGSSAEEGIATYGMWCDLVGHNYTVESVTTIQHKVDPVAPRCLSQVWELHICTMCEHFEETLLTQNYIFCCPEE